MKNNKKLLEKCNTVVKILPFDYVPKVKELIKKFDSVPEKLIIKQPIIKKQNLKKSNEKNIFPDNLTILNKMHLINSLTNLLKNKENDSCVKVSEILKNNRNLQKNSPINLKYIFMQCNDLGLFFK
ncbi:hypothetical protein TUBRATIS_10220 [Tubulinosema ratisbonensis]|uniref:Uncharacterized protein n=1 Tax=Tubulinosema ratisbonensis TaxID=291195 RepID=A0A437AMR4_9MICR|nr:hypothetical protein TUBRATIS_10220 [Tubulinosema ratisbonensis]